MYDFVDRVPTDANRKKITKANGSVEYATVEFADNPTQNGTPLNRNVFMALQGMEASSVEFASDGSIVVTYDTGVLTTTFPEGLIARSIFVGNSGFSVTKETYIEDGQIKTTISN